ncbi:MAG: saccharopine dehydrogenase NADP-binding domain-containing protein [Proteobacteria bacterium]|nr:saccharopine dehydrogenase NADP-binding domain-containing protein [Pseudomonadota bacterium]
MGTTIHWLGAGLSSTPGIRRLADGENPLIVWNLNRDGTRASLLAAGVDTDVREFGFEALRGTIAGGDIVVSMLPATLHVRIAEMCLELRADFVSSSYVTPGIAALEREAESLGLRFVNESGLDPGIDHLFSHLLVDEYRESAAVHPENRFHFRSYCGGFPATVNDFRYKFSWSPLGTLLALTSPARWIEGGARCEAPHPWDATRQVRIGAADETFQAYPNRDSLPFLGQYGFDPGWHIEEFVRGTLRPDGWAQAWQPVFAQIAAADGKDIAARLEPLADDLARRYGYEPGEPDRVVLSIELEVTRDDRTAWFGSCLIDSCGDGRGQAMARLVSLPVSIAAQSVIAGDFEPGVHAATTDPPVIRKWLDRLSTMGEDVVLTLP